MSNVGIRPQTFLVGIVLLLLIGVAKEVLDDYIDSRFFRGWNASRARSAIKTLEQTDFAHLWAQLAPFTEELLCQDRLKRLEIHDRRRDWILPKDARHISVFIIQDDQCVSSYLVDGKLIPSGPTSISSINNSRIIPLEDSILSSQEAVDYILGWIQKCNDYGVCGFDLRDWPRSCYIGIRDQVHFEVLGEDASPWTREFNFTYAQKGFTPAGDILRHVTNDVFITTKRR